MRHATICLTLALLLSTGCAGLGRRLIKGHHQRQRARAGLTVKGVAVAGHQMAYVEGGALDGEPVVLVHGFTGEKSNWYAFAEYLSEDHHLFAMDLPPFGESPAVEGTVYTIEGHVERLAAFLEAVGVERAHLVGNSMGGHAVALFALDHPERVISLALFDSAGITSPEKSEMQRIIEETGDNTFGVETREDLELMLRLTFHEQPMIPGAAKIYLLEQLRLQNDQTLRLFKAYQEHWVALEPDLPRITVPTLVLWGEKDRITDPSSVAVFAEGLPNETVVIMKDCGHVPMMERPEETAGHYLDFLETVGSR